MPPAIDGVLETALYCRDLEVTARFYRDLFGFRELMHEAGRLVALQIGETRQVLLLFAEGHSTKGVDTPGGHIAGHDGSGPLHVCFVVTPDELARWQTYLPENGIPIESVVQVDADDQRRGGTSVYFRDPDGHAVEIATSGIWPWR